MKWKIATISCVIGVGFYAAWYVVATKPLKPGEVPDFKSIRWLMAAGSVFLAIGTTVFAHLIAGMMFEKIYPFLKGFKKSDRV